PDLPAEHGGLRGHERGLGEVGGAGPDAGAGDDRSEARESRLQSRDHVHRSTLMSSRPPTDPLEGRLRPGSKEKTMPFAVRLAAATVAAAASIVATATFAQDPSVPLIPRALLFGNPTQTQGRVSPDGKWISWIAPRDGVLNIWVAPAN